MTSSSAGSSQKIIIVDELRSHFIGKLLEIYKNFNLKNAMGLRRQQLISIIMRDYAEKGFLLMGGGVAEITCDGFGFLRSLEGDYLPTSNDVYISPDLVKKYHLRTGDGIYGSLKPPAGKQQYFSLQELQTVNDEPADKQVSGAVHFESLLPCYPTERFVLEVPSEQPALPTEIVKKKISTPQNGRLGLVKSKKQTVQGEDISCRVIDVIAPVGKGQRALIVSPPRVGKTVLLQNIACSIVKNHPECILLILLIDERPEEVTDMRQVVKGAEVISSTFDEPATRHVQVAEMVRKRARVLVEKGKDVVILLDSITRLGRAYNTTVPSSGKVLTGGVDSTALQRPKRFFGSARNIKDGGSLTIIATALVDTGGKMDEVIFEEFKGTGNAEIVLDRKLADKRIFPALDVLKSGTRKEELLVPPDELPKMHILRRLLHSMGSAEGLEFLRERIRRTKTNEEFYRTMNE